MNTEALKEAIDFIEAYITDGPRKTLVLDAARLVLASQVAESELEAAVKAGRSVAPYSGKHARLRVQLAAAAIWRQSHQGGEL